jgi:type IV pilus assembly protein PilY1
MNIKHKFKAVITGFALAMCVTAPLHADDIEIYTGGGLGATTIQPNVMFIIDTSGSMTRDVPNPLPPYDSTVTYSGPYDNTQIYYSTSSNINNCCGSNSHFDKTANTCDHSVKTYDDTGAITDATAGPLQNIGYYSDQIAQLSLVASGNWQHRTYSYQWHAMNSSNNTAAERAYPVECKRDAGIHGKTSGSPDKWIADSSTGWTNSDQNPRVWRRNRGMLWMYDGNYLNYYKNPGTGTTQNRIQVVKAGVKAIVDSNNNINICLMRYDRYAQGGPVVFPCTDVKTGRVAFEAALDDLQANGNTPLAETYYEALRYFGGKKIDYGATSTPTSAANTREGSTGNYQTPITAPCQENDIVYLTDGQPTSDFLSQARQASLASSFPTGQCDVGGPYWDSNLHAFSSATSTDDNCLDELAGWAYNYDVAERDSDYASHVGKQNIITYTIGFGEDVDAGAVQLLKDTAIAGHGKYYPATDQKTLQDTFNDVLGSVLAVNSTFSSPAVSVNAFNRATNLDDLYFTLFKPDEGPHWDGNLKKFKLVFDTNNVPVITDQAGASAVDSGTGFFTPGSISYWTQPADAPDGAETAQGGAASRLTLPTDTPPRHVYTFTGTYSDSNGVMSPSTVTSADLTTSANLLSDTNTNITDTMLGGVAANSDVTYIHSGSDVTVSYTTALLMWAEGYDIKNTVLKPDGSPANEAIQPRRVMGDPLHSQPALVQYGQIGSGSTAQPDLVAYVATNDGYLHAFNSLTGQEYFSFVPQELLPNLDTLFEDSSGVTKVYGLDGDVVPWINDVNKNGTIDSGDSVYLYVGQRRGVGYNADDSTYSSNYYSLDVTDRTKPKLRWVIKGGKGDFAELGETWSAPDVAKLKLGGTDRTVLIFGAGYDIAQDSVLTRTPDNKGRGIYIVDADTGQMLWRAGPDSGASTQMTNMQYSIPGRIKALDIDGDGYIDRLYAGDMGGQIWRFDIKPSDTSSDLSTLITGGRIADLDVDGDATAARRFYYPPDVALIAEPGKAPYLSVVAVSGYRAHPLNTTIHDRAYMIRDNDVYNQPANADYAAKMVTESNLFDTTNNYIGGDGNATQQASALAGLNSKKGWFISLNQADGSGYKGEKGLSEPLILNGTAIFTTYIPENNIAPVVDACTSQQSAGTGSVFYVNVTDGTPTEVNAGTVGTRTDRQTYVKRSGIPPSPTVIVTDKGDATCVGTECKDAKLSNSIQKSYWYEQQ